MKIIFFKEISYPIIDCRVPMGEDNSPIDIMLKGDLETLITIGENHCKLGFNYKEEKGYSVALYTRLEPFNIVDYK